MAVPKETIEATLDDRHVPFDWDEATMVANGGYYRCTGTIPEKHARRVYQGSVLTLWRPNGKELWQGRQVAPPSTNRGVATVSAVGGSVLAEKYGSRITEQTRDYGLFKPGDSEPHNYKVNGTIRVDAQGGRLLFEVPAGTKVNVDNVGRLIAWTPGVVVTKVAFNWAQTAQTAAYQLLVQSARGPNGTLTTRATVSLSGAASGTVTASWTGTDDMVVLSYKRVAGTTGTAYRYLAITNLRVYGMAGGDSLSPGQIAADIGGLLGYDTAGVTLSSVNALPFDWMRGSASGALDYLAMLDDVRWLVTERTAAGTWKLTFGPWAKVWDVAQERTAAPDLDDLELFNRVTVRYETLTGSPAAFSLDADPNPLAAAGIVNEHTEELQDRQPSDALAASVAALQLSRLSARRVRGSIEVAEAWGSQGPEHPYAIMAGDLVNVRDWSPAVPPQRIVSVAYRRDGGADLQVEQDVSPARLFALASLVRERV